MEIFAYNKDFSALPELLKFSHTYFVDQTFHARLNELKWKWRVLGNKDAHAVLKEVGGRLFEFGKLPKPHPSLVNVLYNEARQQLKEFVNKVDLGDDMVVEDFANKNDIPEEISEPLIAEREEIRRRKLNLEEIALKLVDYRLQCLPEKYRQLAPDTTSKNLKELKRQPNSKLQEDVQDYLNSNRAKLSWKKNWIHSDAPIIPEFHPDVTDLWGLLILKTTQTD